MQAILKKLAVRIDEQLGGSILILNTIRLLARARRTLRIWSAAA